MVEKVQGTDAGPGKGFHGVAADAAQTEHSHTGGPEAAEGIVTQQGGGAGELSIHDRTSCHFLKKATAQAPGPAGVVSAVGSMMIVTSMW
jgi:hypothetical protein